MSAFSPTGLGRARGVESVIIDWMDIPTARLLPGSATRSGEVPDKVIMQPLTDIRCNPDSYSGNGSASIL